MRWLALLPALLLGALLTSGVGAAAPNSGRLAWVIDGDTVRLASGERIRIADIDAAESRRDQAKCAAEIRRGTAATRAAIALFKGRVVTIKRVGKSYTRTVARLTLDGDDVAAMLLAKGIARPWPRGRPKPDWCSV